MPVNKVHDPEKLLGKLKERESTSTIYGFIISDIILHTVNEEIEDIALRTFKQNMVLEGGGALVLRKDRSHFIHEVLKCGFGDHSSALNMTVEVIEYNSAANKLSVYLRLPTNFLNQKLSPMHSLDVSSAKNEIGNSLVIFWNFRAENQQFTVNTDNTIGVRKVPNLVIGVDGKGEAILVQQDDHQRRLVFKDLYASLSWRLNHKLSMFRLKDLHSLKKPGFMKDWKEPGLNMDRKLPCRLVCFEMMGRIIHEFLLLAKDSRLTPGDEYFASRIDRCSQHNVQLVERKDNSNFTDLTFSSDLFEKCVLHIDTSDKYAQYIAAQFHEVNLEIVFPENLMIDSARDKPENSHFIHHCLFVDFSNEADTCKDDPSFPTYFEEVALASHNLQYIRNYNTTHNTRFYEKAFFIKWIGKMEHALDVQDAKLQDGQKIILYWQHRGENQQFCLEETQQTLHPLGKFELAWGCRDLALKLVPTGSPEMLRFSNISSFLNKDKETRLDSRRMQEIGAMSRSTTEWDSPVVYAYGLFNAITEATFRDQRLS